MDLLVAVDGSEESEAAVAHAAKIADATDGSLTLVHAVTPDVSTLGEEGPFAAVAEADERLLVESVEEAEQRGLELLEAAVEQAADHGHDADSELLHGEPGEAIPAFAAAEGFDAIVAGHRGRSERAEQLVGSVAKTLVERATVPVTVVR